jgi:hypothetical protein
LGRYSLNNGVSGWYFIGYWGFVLPIDLLCFLRFDGVNLWDKRAIDAIIFFVG